MSEGGTSGGVMLGTPPPPQTQCTDPSSHLFDRQPALLFELITSRSFRYTSRRWYEVGAAETCLMSFFQYQLAYHSLNSTDPPSLHEDMSIVLAVNFYFTWLIDWLIDWLTLSCLWERILYLNPIYCLFLCFFYDSCQYSCWPGGPAQCFNSVSIAILRQINNDDEN